MMPPSSRRLRVLGIAVAVLLVGVAFYSGTLAAPYVTADDTPRYAHTIVPESSPLYEEYTDGYDHEVYQYEELSPVAQELFDRTRAAEPREQYNDERRYIPDVCRNFMLVCDSYTEDEMPTEFTYGTELSYEEAFVFVEDGDRRYLLQTGITGHLFLAPFPTGFVLSWLTMLPLAAFAALVALRSESPRLLAGVIAGGVLATAIGVGAPYVAYAGLLPAWVLGVMLLAGVWTTILAAGGSSLYERVTNSE